MEWSRTADGPARVEALLLSWRKPNDFLLATHCIIARARGSTAACLCRGLDGGAPDHGRRNDCCRWPGVVPSTTHGAPGATLSCLHRCGRSLWGRGARLAWGHCEALGLRADLSHLARLCIAEADRRTTHELIPVTCSCPQVVKLSSGLSLSIAGIFKASSHID